MTSFLIVRRSGSVGLGLSFSRSEVLLNLRRYDSNQRGLAMLEYLLDQIAASS